MKRMKLPVKDLKNVSIRPLVNDALERSASFRQLSLAKQKTFAANLEKVTAQLAGPTRQFVEAVDFPAFVTEIIEGVFDSIVDSSIQQMEAYQDLLNDVAGSIDGDDTSEDARDVICRKLAKIARVKWPPE
jgi:hypothetical protein